MEGHNSRLGKEAKKPSTRLQRHAPPSLQLDPRPDASAAWKEVGSRTAIPLLSPLALSPIPWMDTKAYSLEEDRGCAWFNAHAKAEEARRLSGGWRHPALPVMAPEPAALLPLFQLQCALEHNAQSPTSPALPFA